MVRKIINDYHLTAFQGVMFILLGMMSAYRGVVEDFIGHPIHWHHWLVAFGVVNLLMTAVFMVVGARALEQAVDDAHRTARASDVDVLRANLKAIESRIETLEKREEITHV